MPARPVQHKHSIMSMRLFLRPAAGPKCLKIYSTRSFLGPGKDGTFSRFHDFAGRRPAVQPCSGFFVRDGIRVAVDPVGLPFGGLAMAGVFLLIAVMGATASALARRQTRQRAIFERAARTQRTTALIDPKVLSVAMQAGRALGWQRLIPLALLGFLAAQWVQEARRRDVPDRVI